MIRIRIVQCLCGPARHAILAMALHESPEVSDVDALVWLRAAVELLHEGRGAELGVPIPAKLNPWCGLCGAPLRDWRYEIGWSVPFADWEAAQRVLRASEKAQDSTRLLLDLLDQSFDAKVRNPGGATH